MAENDKIRALHRQTQENGLKPAEAAEPARPAVEGGMQNKAVPEPAANAGRPSENTPVVDSGFKPGTVLRHQNRHIRDVYLVVGREKNGGRYLLLGEDPVSIPVLRESSAEGLEPAPLPAYQASLVYENTDADKAYRLFEGNSEPYRDAYELIDKADFFVPFGQTAPEAGKRPAAPEKHYSEKIIDRLAEQYGWTKEDGMSASKILSGISEGGMLNPEGRLKVFARFDETGRYLSLERGWDTLFDIDARGVHTDAAAALFNDCAGRLSFPDKPFDRAEIEMRLYGMDLYHSAQQSPEAAEEAREILPAPHLCTPERFAGYARAVPSDTGRRWEVRWPEVSGYGMNYTFSDAATAPEAVRDAHRIIINSSLHHATGGGIRQPDREQLPPQEVLAYYPDLAKRYLPSGQTPADKFQAAKDSYVRQTLTLPPAKQERRRLLESQLENLIRGLPEQTQMQARTNFYTSQVAEQTRQKQPPAAPDKQGEISFDR